jgi:hypothetical protein
MRDASRAKSTTWRCRSWVNVPDDEWTARWTRLEPIGSKCTTPQPRTTRAGLIRRGAALATRQSCDINLTSS